MMISGRPTSSYIMPNQEHTTPVAYDGSAVSMAAIALANQGNAYTPSYVQIGMQMHLLFINRPKVGT